jgi:hypothetical protein
MVEVLAVHPKLFRGPLVDRDRRLARGCSRKMEPPSGSCIQHSLRFRIYVISNYCDFVIAKPLLNCSFFSGVGFNIYVPKPDYDGFHLVA